MECKQKYPMDVVIKALRCCGQKGGCPPDCPFVHYTLDVCDAINLQAADMLEIMSAILKKKEIFV